MQSTLDSCCELAKKTDIAAGEISKDNIPTQGEVVLANLKQLVPLVSTKHENRSYTEAAQLSLIDAFEAFSDLLRGLFTTLNDKRDMCSSAGLQNSIDAELKGLVSSYQELSSDLENCITFYSKEVKDTRMRTIEDLKC
ncbi:hypothetical protein N7490_007322 [Penicillium lividum]|nr:hypothetical protein N7490_007322 [Penicillium lividum]